MNDEREMLDADGYSEMRAIREIEYVGMMS